MNHVTRSLWSIQLNSSRAKIGGHCPSKGEDKMFFIYQGIKLPMSHVTRGMRFPQIGATLFYCKLGQTLLQIGAASLLQIGKSATINWEIYYKLPQPLIKNRATITNSSKIHYKLGQVLQIRKIITNWDITVVAPRCCNTCPIL